MARCWSIGAARRVRSSNLNPFTYKDNSKPGQEDSVFILPVSWVVLSEGV